MKVSHKDQIFQQNTVQNAIAKVPPTWKSRNTFLLLFSFQ